MISFIEATVSQTCQRNPPVESLDSKWIPLLYELLGIIFHKSISNLPSIAVVPKDTFIFFPFHLSLDFLTTLTNFSLVLKPAKHSGMIPQIFGES